ncbi:MAG TPA: 3-dehydroquinate synthase [Sphingobacterium sp.]|nr:3-dehydroquinate synthase [Sphingobacterium sp.]
MLTIKSIDYKVVFEESLNSLVSFIQQRSYSQVIVLVDTNTREYCLPILQETLGDQVSFDIVEVDPGEENKNIDYCVGVWQTLLDFGADRNALLINLGGGVVTDLGGFVASTYKRGIDFVQVPTTILSQVDASVGGKTGIDMDHLKNVIGTFTQPKSVFISTRFLNTLNTRQQKSGLAEIIKHGLIFSKPIYEKAKNIATDKIDQELIFQSVEVKNEVIKQDPKEKNIRKILNFGHTVGHAIEAYSLSHDKDPLLHGEAIAMGMICEAYLSHLLNDLSSEELEDITQTFLQQFPFYEYSASIYPELLKLMQNDKKNQNHEIGFSLLNSIGKCDYNIYASESDIISALDYYKTFREDNR